MELNIRRDVVVSDKIIMKLEEMIPEDLKIVKKMLEDLFNSENYMNGCITDEMLEYFFLPRIDDAYNNDVYKVSRRLAVEVLKNKRFAEGKISFDELSEIFTKKSLCMTELLFFKIMNDSSIADKKISLPEHIDAMPYGIFTRLNLEDFIRLFTSDNFLDGKIPYDIVNFLIKTPYIFKLPYKQVSLKEYKYCGDYYTTLYTSKNFGDGILSEEELKDVMKVDNPAEYVDILTSVEYRNKTFSREKMYFAKHGNSMLGKTGDVYKAIKESKAFNEGRITIDDLIDFYEWNGNYSIIFIIYKLMELANEFEYIKDELDELIEIVFTNVQEISDLTWNVRKNGHRDFDEDTSLVAKRIFCGKFRPSREQNVNLGVHKLVRTKEGK